MRYPSDQKEKARKALLSAGAREIKRNGINGIGVDGIAVSAGVTSGAFYSNFSSKEEMLENVINLCLGDFFIDPESGSSSARMQRLEEWLKAYLDAGHRSDPASGCVVPALSADVARSSDTVRATYKRKMMEWIAKLTNALEGDLSDRERRASCIIAMMTGAIAISRAMPDGDEADRVLDAALQGTLALLRSA
jgi:TetR/AcrR family transcriptional repressor of nem operon